VRTGVKIRTDVPSEVGSDLVCAAAAVRELVDGPCVIVDFDAAIAFSAIGRSGDFLGAAIAPGIGTAAAALREAAALLPEVPLAWPLPGRSDDPGPAIGKSTAQSVRAGIGFGYAGLVDRIVRRQREELVALGEADTPEAVAVIGTGDEEGRELFSSLGLGRFIPELVLEGVAIIAARVAPAARTVI
jgi:type III pantothenate kinase